MANALSDGDSSVGWHASKALADAGEAARAHTDALVAYAERTDDVFDHAVAALARIGDPRAIQLLLRRSANRWWPVGYQPVSVLAGLHGQADGLLPAIRQALSPETEANLVPVLIAWGPAAVEAVPELVSLLDGPRTFRASAALGMIGPQAHDASTRLASLALDPHAHVRCPSSQAAAWAHWRITGEPELQLRVIGAAVGMGPGHSSLRYLAELGPLAHKSERSVRDLLTSAGAWTRVEAANAFWRITGDPQPSVPVLMEALQPRPIHRWNELAIASAGYLAEIGSPAVGAIPLLRQLCAGDRRVVQHARADEALTEAVSAALAKLARNDDIGTAR